MADFTPPAYVREELEFTSVIEQGARGNRAKRVQEWLTFGGSGTAIDSDYGPATKAAVKVFQQKRGLPVTGRVNRETWEVLTAPLEKVLQSVSTSGGAKATMLRVARKHLAVHPIELGGANRGPWVRVYMAGNEGADWPWCAGFVTFVMRQAYALLGQSAPIRGSFSCDSLKAQASDAGLFVPGRDIERGNVSWSDLGACQIFLVRRTSTDWTHTGFSFDGDDDVFSTIEGNTNDEGSREGYEVCARTRGIGSKDFIRFPD